MLIYLEKLVAFAVSLQSEHGAEDVTVLVGF